MTLALDKRTVTCINNKLTTSELPALHSDWVVEHGFVCYKTLDEESSVDRWTERLESIKEDLDWLLRLSHEKFWCQVAFDDTVKNSFRSYLVKAKRPYDLVPNDAQSEKSLALEKQLNRLYFLVFLRLSTHKESKEHFLTPEGFGSILFDKRIFDVASLMALCAIYGSSNGQLLSKMLGNIFTQQPKYEQQLNNYVPHISQSLRGIIQQFGGRVDDSNGFGSKQRRPEKLGAGGAQARPIAVLNEASFIDATSQLIDVAWSLHYFLDIYEHAADCMLEASFLASLVESVEQLQPLLQQEFSQRLEKKRGPERDTLLSFSHGTSEALICIVKTFRQIISHHCIQPVLENRSAHEVQNGVEAYMSIFLSHLTDKVFIGFYDDLYHIEDDFDIFRQSQCVIDETRISFILEAVKGSTRSRIRLLTDSNGQDTAGVTAAPPTQLPPLAMTVNQNDVADMEMAACAPLKQMSDFEIQSLISSVKDLLPDLGDGFIELCLEEFNYDLEPVINSLLEDKLPASLKSLDRHLQVKPQAKKEPVAQAAAASAASNSVLDSRRNVYQNDEFDVFSHNEVDLSRIHIGKREHGVEHLSQHEKDMQLIMSKKYQFALVDVDSADGGDDGNWREYDDEYDDTYDENMIGSQDIDSADELAGGRRFVIPRVLGGNATAAAAPEEEEEEEEPEEPKNRDEFVPNPEKVREEQERRRQAKMANRGGGGGRWGGGGGGGWGSGGGGGGQHREVKEHDVKGRAKGQGQTDEVLRNRAFKERNKGSRVNHNRKDMADRKRRV